MSSMVSTPFNDVGDLFIEMLKDYLRVKNLKERWLMFETTSFIYISIPFYSWEGKSKVSI